MLDLAVKKRWIENDRKTYILKYRLESSHAVFVLFAQVLKYPSLRFLPPPQAVIELLPSRK